MLFEFSLFGCYSLSMHLRELLIVFLIVTYKRTLMFFCFFFLQILGYFKIIMKVMINDIVFYVEQNCTCVF